MSNAPKNATERVFQQNFVEELSKYKWETPDYLDGNKQKVTVEDLIHNWRQELNRLNADQLEGVPLTDMEFSQVMSKINQIANSYEAAKLLAMEGSIGKIDGIYRDANPNISRKQITLTIFKKAQVSGGDSSYKVAREIQTSHDNRFDIVLLINGLPLINIEQKRTDKSINEAIGQFQRYYRDGEYTNNFMAFSQMMVVTTEIETCYFATPKTIADFNPAFVFHWSVNEQVVDRNGRTITRQRQITNWQEVIERLLMIPMAHQMVGDYLVIDEDPFIEENRRHMLMRPYQVYALQAIEGAAIGFDNKDRIPHGGFVWHTTGSGKTITSFKTALFLSTRAGFDKVVFLVDRRDLDDQTSKSFKAYATYEPVTVDETKSTFALRKQLTDSKNGIIVTTTFKLNSLVKELQEASDYSLSDKKIVFIVDEAHRTTMGQMMGSIKDYFREKGLFFGFTGTPLFDENKVQGKINEKSELINTTEKLFGPLLHQYTIDEAIADGNVLGFHVDYLNTGEFSSYDDLREQLIEVLKQDKEKHKKTDREIERVVLTLSDLEVEEEAVKRGILVYQDQTHIPRVVTEILDNWEEQSQEGQFNAILTVAYKQRVIDYYHEFKKQIGEKYQDNDVTPNIAMTFSFGNENDPDNISPEIIKEMFNDYASFTGITFDAGDKKHGEKAYFEDLTERAKRGGSGRNPKNIDIVIVADQLLTGYDAKRLNTLYVDRQLELQGLIQAYSRTNRVFGSQKEFGTIINFQFPRITEASVTKALELYGSGGNSSRVIVEEYQSASNKLKPLVIKLQGVLNDPTNWAILKEDDEEKEAFKEAFLETLHQISTLEQYYEYHWDDDLFGLTEHSWFQYIGAFKNLFKPTTGVEPRTIDIIDLVGKTKIQGSQVIDAQHILSLLGSRASVENGVHVIDSESLRLIYEKIQELSNAGENEKALQLRAFVDEYLLEHKLSSDVDFDTAFLNWQQAKQHKEVEQFSSEWGIDTKILEGSLRAYNLRQPDVIPYLYEIVQSSDADKATNEYKGSKLLLNINLTDELPKWMIRIKTKYE